MTKKWLCLMLALLLAVATLSACATEHPDDDEIPDNGGDSNDEQKDPEQDPWLDDLPEMDLSDIEIVFAYYDSGDIKSGCSVDAEENNGDLINDSMYKRNTAIEERFHVSVSGENLGTGGIAAVVKPVLTAGSS